MRARLLSHRFLLLGFCTLAVILIYHFSKPNYPTGTLRLFALENPYRYRPLIHTVNCSNSHRILLIVTSYVGHVKLRSAHRRSMPQSYLDKYNATRVFLLAQIPQHEKTITQNAVEEESKTFKDILQGSFIENYRNLTYKHLMGLNWAGSNCSSVEYVIKLDDDTVFNFERVHDLLPEYNPSEKIIVGYVLNGTKPHREKTNKWFVSHDEYPYENYPPYVSGWLYITTPSTASIIVKTSAYRSYFWIDDIFITGILASELNIKIIDLKPKKIWLEYYELMECCLRDMIQRNLSCDYAISPNGGRNNLIYEFNKALSHCKVSGSCKKRTDKQILKKTCIVEAERTVFGQGESQVKLVHL